MERSTDSVSLNNSPRLRRLVRFIPAGVIIGGLAFIQVMATLVWNPKAIEVQNGLEHRFGRITHFPGARMLSYVATHKTGQALVGATFATSASTSEIEQYYSDVLPSLGWRYSGRTVATSWGDRMGEILYYCDEHFLLSLQTVDKTAPPADWDFALSISWGLPSRWC